MDAPNLKALEAAKGGPFRMRWRGQGYTLPDPLDLSYEQLAQILFSEHVTDTPFMPTWKRDALFAQWRAHYDLPPFPDLQRLSYLVEHYRAAMEYDLRAQLGVDLVDLWRAREWRKLLTYVDHLPSNTWYSQSVLNDPDHIRMLLEAEERAPKSDDDEPRDTSPPLQTWSPEVAALTDVLDAVRSVRHAIVAANTPSKSSPPKHPDPAPRPKSGLERARKVREFERKKAKHDSLVARVLPHKSAQV